MPENTPPVSDPELLSAAIAASGLSVRRFAREILLREPRTVWRWLAGENALPALVREKCAAIIQSTPDSRAGEASPDGS